MTNEILQRVAKQHKINLNHYDEVFGYINQKYTYILVTFAVRENLAGNAHHLLQHTVKLSVAAIMNRFEDETEYTTDGWEWIFNIKNK